MDFGVVMQCNPPASRVVELAVAAENRGFTHVWTFDSHVLWHEPNVIYSQILAATRNADRGADGHQPADAGCHGHGLDVRDAQLHLRQPHHLRHRPW